MKKKLFLIACSLLFSLGIWAQEEVRTVDTIADEEIVSDGTEESGSQSNITYGGSSYDFIFSWKKKAKNPHWTGFGFGFANFDDLKGADLKMSTSYSFILNLIDFSIPINHHWLFVSGGGIDWTRYHFKGDVGLEEVNGVTQFVPAGEGVDYNSSKLLTYYITVPLLLEYQTKVANRNTFFVSGGIVGYLKCYSKSQIDIKQGKGVEKVTLGRDLNLLPVHARFLLQAGIDDISLFAYYSPFSLFKDDKGPDIHPIGIGVMLNF